MLKTVLLILLLLLTGCKPVQVANDAASATLTLYSSNEAIGIDDSFVTKIEAADPYTSGADIVITDLVEGIEKIDFNTYKLLALYQAEPYLIIASKDNYAYGNCGYLADDERAKILLKEVKADLNLYYFKEYANITELLEAFSSGSISSILVTQSTYWWYKGECGFELYENENLNELYRLKNGFSFLPKEGIFVKQAVINNYLNDLLKITNTVRQSANSDSSIQNIKMASEAYDATQYYLSLFDQQLSEKMIVR